MLQLLNIVTKQTAGADPAEIGTFKGQFGPSQINDPSWIDL